jgi:hypothetical protein
MPATSAWFATVASSSVTAPALALLWIAMRS